MNTITFFKVGTDFFYVSFMANFVCAIYLLTSQLQTFFASKNYIYKYIYYIRYNLQMQVLSCFTFRSVISSQLHDTIHVQVNLVIN